MRKKKFRKITVKNIASIYGKISGIRDSCIRSARRNNLPRAFMTSCVYINDVESIELGTIMNVEVTLVKEENLINIRIQHKSLSRNDIYCTQCNIPIGRKIHLTGSSVKYKCGKDMYEISFLNYNMVPFVHGFYRYLPGDFDGNIIDDFDKSSIIPSRMIGFNLAGFEDMDKIKKNSIYGRMMTDLTDFTENDLPPIGDVLQGVSELEKHIDDYSREMKFELPKNWDRLYESEE